MTTYRIDASGSSDAARLGAVTYSTQPAAAEALRAARGWPAVVLSEPYDTEQGEAVSAYPSEAERDRDVDGAHWPAIVRLRYDFSAEMRAAQRALGRPRRKTDLFALLRTADRHDAAKGGEALKTLDDLIGRWADGEMRGGARLLAAWQAAGRPETA
jgi:hypothetical protein